MLTSVTVSNFTVVKNLTLPIPLGFNVITGETGAGKSIVFDAISLCLGGRADPEKIRSGEDNAVISAVFNVQDLPNAKDYLLESGFGCEGGECSIRRIITTNGRSKAFINNHACNVSHLKELGQSLVNICGQHEHYALQDAKQQRSILDQYGQCESLLETMAHHYNELKLVRSELDILLTNQAARADKKELLSYQVGELDEFGPAENEYKELDVELMRLSNASDILENGHSQLHTLRDNDDGSIISLLSAVKRGIERLASQDSSITQLLESCESASIEIEQVASDLDVYLGNVEQDPLRLNDVNVRFQMYRDLARKHRCETHDLHEIHCALSEELKSISGDEGNIEGLQHQILELEKTCSKHALKLSKQRIDAGKTLSKHIEEHMQRLGMEGGKCGFDVEFSEDKIGVFGGDSIALMIKTNPGEKMGMLSKVASGGELSRISLVIQLALAERQSVGTLLFDEVDVGISGPTAAVVGAMLKGLGKYTQVLSITHLPQVAACGDNHFVVEKQRQGERTESAMQMLSDSDRISHIARLLGGGTLDKTAMANAESLLMQGQ
jgi:DNA repair protein RecN (Recombination protein N)